MTKAFFLLLFISQSVFAQQVRLIVGTYTKGASEGIYVYDFNAATGKARLMDSAKTTNPSFLAVSANGTHVYCVNENGQAEGGGTVTAFQFTKSTGKLKELNKLSSVGIHPCYIALDKTGQWVGVANYTSGTVSVLRIRKDGSLGDSTFSVQHMGKGFNKERQAGPHIHAALFSPDNKYLMVTDLGMDRINTYAFDKLTGRLTTINGRTGFDLPVSYLPKGSGPRHLAFHPTRKWVYSVQELSGAIAAFNYNDGALIEKSTTSLLPSDYRGTPTSAHIQVSPDGRFLYASNRNPSNTIAVFKINTADGTLELVGHQGSGGKAPRHFNFDPSGNFLLVANQDSDKIAIFRINRKTGLLSPNGQEIKVPKPVCIQWVR